MKTCPNCQETTKDDAILCIHCGHQFRPIEAASSPRPTPNVVKFGCGIAIIAAIALVLWYFSGIYQSTIG